MPSYVTRDPEGREVLVRTGSGRVAAVVPIGDPEGPTLLHRVEIACDPPAGRARAIRYSTQALLDALDPMVVAAIALQESDTAVRWSIEWHRHAWIPADLPISSLALATDARAILTDLAPLGSGVDRESVTEGVGSPREER